MYISKFPSTCNLSDLFIGSEIIYIMYIEYMYRGKWLPRCRGGDRIISQIYSVSPSDSEKFHLRLLLLHVTGAKGFDD